MKTRLARLETKLDRLIFVLFGIGATFAVAQVAILVRLFWDDTATLNNAPYTHRSADIESNRLPHPSR